MNPTNFSGTKQKVTRRRLLKGAGQMAAMAAATSLMPPNVQRALAQGTLKNGEASLADVKHVVILMQENRSFDHYFGTLNGVRGFDDPHALKGPNGKPIFYQPDEQHPDGHMLPFHLDTKASGAQKFPSASHAWAVQHQAWNGGKMDQWMPAHRKADGVHAAFCMGYYKREDIPFQFALAEAFTLCDAYHCSVMGPTWPNRTYLMTGMVDPEGKDGGPMISNKAPKGGFTWTTYPERLEKAGVSWKIYQQKDNYGCNMLANYAAFQNAAPGSPLYVRGMTRDEEGTFERDAVNDKLPTVSWIIPPGFQSEHPDYMPADGAAFVASKIDAIAANPEVWAKTVFILTYDENDGIFDHVAPPVPAAGTKGEFINGLPVGGGFRVPTIVVSPWSVGGWVCSENFDHTSVLRFLEKLTGVKEENITDWRRKTFGDLTATLRFKDSKQAAPVLPDVTRILDTAKYSVAMLPKAAVPATQVIPVQEKGSRKKTKV